MNEQERFDLMRDEIIDLKNEINRLQAENEVLEARIGVYETCNARKDEAIKHLESEVKRLQAENKRLKKENHHFADIGKMYSEVKAEAYKEFVERLNKIEKFRSCVESDNYELSVTMREVDNLLKELVIKNDIGRYDSYTDTFVKEMVGDSNAKEKE
jgi:chromosome segregation ATPase